MSQFLPIRFRIGWSCYRVRDVYGNLRHRPG